MKKMKAFWGPQIVIGIFNFGEESLGDSWGEAGNKLSSPRQNSQNSYDGVTRWGLMTATR